MNNSRNISSLSLAWYLTINLYMHRILLYRTKDFYILAISDHYLVYQAQFANTYLTFIGLTRVRRMNMV